MVKINNNFTAGGNVYSNVTTGGDFVLGNQTRVESSNTGSVGNTTTISSSGGSVVHINGRRIQVPPGNVSIINNKIYVNGQPWSEDGQQSGDLPKEAAVTITIESVQGDLAIEQNGSFRGNIKCGDVGGDIKTTGSVECGTVGGSVKTTGSVTVSGDVCSGGVKTTGMVSVGRDVGGGIRTMGPVTVMGRNK